jgi:hypothetical protein
MSPCWILPSHFPSKTPAQPRRPFARFLLRVQKQKIEEGGPDYRVTILPNEGADA